MKRVLGHPRPLSVEAQVYRGCPCRNHQSATESRMTLWQSANPVRAVGACPVILSPLANVFVSLSLCDGVLHRETVILQTNCVSRVLWHIGMLTKGAARATTGLGSCDKVGWTQAGDLQITKEKKQASKRACNKDSKNQLKERETKRSAGSVNDEVDA